MFLRHDHTQFVAVCDVQAARRDAGKNTVDKHYNNTDCQAYNDFRDVLARPDIDAVYVATPDHWHALVTTAAARAGKHIYCQKPLTRTIAEGQAVVSAVRRYDIVFQHGTQQRHDPAMLFGCELVRNGYIGQLQHVQIGSPAGMMCASAAGGAGAARPGLGHVARTGPVVSVHAIANRGAPVVPHRGLLYGVHRRVGRTSRR